MANKHTECILACMQMGIHSFSPSGLEAGAPSPRGPGSRLLKQRAKAAQAAMLAAPPPPAQLSEAFKRRLARGNEREAAALSQLQAGDNGCRKL